MKGAPDCLLRKLLALIIEGTKKVGDVIRSTKEGTKLHNRVLRDGNKVAKKEVGDKRKKEADDDVLLVNAFPTTQENSTSPVMHSKKEHEEYADVSWSENRQKGAGGNQRPSKSLESFDPSVAIHLGDSTIIFLYELCPGTVLLLAWQ